MKKKQARSTHIIVGCNGRVWVQKQRRWRSAAYKARRAIRRGKAGAA